MDINPLVNALWAQRFSNKSTQLPTLAPAKCPAKAVLSVALPNSLISTVGHWTCPSVICVPSQVWKIELLTQVFTLPCIYTLAVALGVKYILPPVLGF